MALESVSVNWLAIIVATIVSFIFGWLWYGPLFGKIWVKSSGMSEKEMKQKKKEGMGKVLLWHFIGDLVMVYVLAMLIGWIGINEFGEVAMLGIYLGVGFLVAGPLLGDVLWKCRPWSFFWINTFYWILNFVIAGSVIVAF
ncbi:DUF1761 domain-containing protein [Candidatus Pacearchaeota archaeon]|nr:DUF1761 domain-containing protein [Candidatus Pacearchaeota archaeon]